MSILKTDEEIDEDLQRILDGEPLDGKSVNRVEEVPKEFKQWLKDNEERIARAKSLPYFIKDNRKVIDGILIDSKPSALDDIIQKLADAKVDYIPVQKLQKQLSEEEIILRISGGDMTAGSCSSLAFAYAGNKCGFDVLDFRGGISQSFFSRTGNIMSIAEKVGGTVAKHTDDFKKAKDLLKLTKKGKEYYFTCGSHAAIVRRTETGFEYLELQSSCVNGFKPLNENVLKCRFIAKESHTIDGIRYEAEDCIIDIDLLRKDSVFRKMLGYINTAKDKQRKGTSGTIK